MAKPKTKSVKVRGQGALRGISFDVTIRTDKLRTWLANHPGEIPPGLTAEQVSELLGE
jgi:hypothetical protein